MNNRHRSVPGFILAILLLARLCFAQAEAGAKSRPPIEKPDFTGTWVLEASQSDIDSGISEYILTIVHREPNITMTKNYKRGKKQIVEKVEYHTDGQAEINPSRRPDDPPPETKWKGRKLVRRSVTRPVGSGSLNFEVVIYEEWSISPDNQTLTRSVDMTTGPSLLAHKKTVFKRSQ